MSIRTFSLFIAVTVLLVASPVGSIHAQVGCPTLSGRLVNNDYRDSSKARHLRTVEQYHFNEDVRSLKGSARGGSGTLRGDLDYTLNHFPNHHPALDTLIRLAIRERSPTPLGVVHIDCRFQLARSVAPNDGMVPLLQAQYFQQIGRARDVPQLLELATTLSPYDANVHYNAGLLYFRLNNFEKALKHAREAYAKGFPLPGLRNMLARAGHPLGD